MSAFRLAVPASITFRRCECCVSVLRVSSRNSRISSRNSMIAFNVTFMLRFGKPETLYLTNLPDPLSEVNQQNWRSGRDCPSLQRRWSAIHNLRFFDVGRALQWDWAHRLTSAVGFVEGCAFI